MAEDASSDSAALDGARSAAEYDAMAIEYRAHNQSSGANAYYERPATKALVGSVSGLRVLEIGCGTGPLTEWLLDQGAEVTALDVSPAMLELARERVGDRAQLAIADLNRPLDTIADASVDLVVASLVMHYVRDWASALAEFRRVLRPGGAVVFSTHHPSWDWRNHCPDDYFAFIQVSEVWIEPHPVTFWRRPLSAMTGAIFAASFVIEQMVEAQPAAELEQLDPGAFDELSHTPFFLHMRLRPANPDGSVAPATTARPFS